MHEEKIPKILAALSLKEMSIKEVQFFRELLLSTHYDIWWHDLSGRVEVLNQTNNLCYNYSTKELKNWDFHS